MYQGRNPRMRIASEVSKYQFFRERLKALYPDEEESELLDTLEGLTDLREMVAAIIRSSLMDEALHKGLKARLEDMRHRAQRLAERAANKRTIAQEAMTDTGLNKLEEPDFTVSLRAGVPPVSIISEADIPEAYWLPQPPKLDRQSLWRELKRGQLVSGAQLGNPRPTLSVRVK